MAALSMGPQIMSDETMLAVEPSASSSWYRDGGRPSTIDLSTVANERVSSTGTTSWSSLSPSSRRISGAARGGLCVVGLALVVMAVVAYKLKQRCSISCSSSSTAGATAVVASSKQSVNSYTGALLSNVV
jgi:hypothetical protein